MKFYTKKGDKGETTLYKKDQDSENVSKSSIRISAIGSIDELNSFLGVVEAFSENTKLKRYLLNIQENLLTIGSILAGSNLRFYKTNTKKLEKTIDEIEKELPLLKNFIFPGGSKTASLLHLARSIARRTEREVVALSEIEEVKPEIIVYLNRLSDYLFILARDVNNQVEIKEKIWVGKKK